MLGLKISNRADRKLVTDDFRAQKDRFQKLIFSNPVTDITVTA
jgi:hypothetical protein